MPVAMCGTAGRASPEPVGPADGRLRENKPLGGTMHKTVSGEPYRITDSPWFWGLLFALVGLVGMGLIAPKYAVRQRQIESRYLGRQQAAEERARRQAGLPAIDLADSASSREEVAPRQIVPLWTLATGAALAALACGTMLLKEWQHAQR
jgi:hypothetical protein